MDVPELAQGGMTYRPPKPHPLTYKQRVEAHQKMLAAAEARGASAERYQAAQTCPMTTKKGYPCQGLAGPTGLCPGHRKQADAQKADDN